MSDLKSTPIVKMSKRRMNFSNAHFGLAKKHFGYENLNSRALLKTLSPRTNVDKLSDNTVLRRIEERYFKSIGNDAPKVAYTTKVQYKYKPKKSSKYQIGHKNFTFTSKPTEVLDVFESNIQTNLKELEEDYDYDVDEKSYALVEEATEAIEVPVASMVPVQNNTVSTTVSGGQRKVGVRGNQANIRLRRAIIRMEGNVERYDADGKCVFNLIYDKYHDARSCKRLLKGDKDDVIDRMSNWVAEADKDNILFDYKTNGLSIYDIEAIADVIGFKIIAYGSDNDLIELYVPKNHNKNVKPLVFVAMSNHIYPIDEDFEAYGKTYTSYVKRYTINDDLVYSNNERTNLVSTDILLRRTDISERKERTIVAPSELEFQIIKQMKQMNILDRIGHKQHESTRNIWFANYLSQTGMELPFPVNAKNIAIDDNKICRVKYAEKIILTYPIDNDCKNFMEKNYNSYQGENPVSILNLLLSDKYGFTLTDAPFLSIFNNHTLKHLYDPKIKNRSHRGLLQDRDYDIPQLLRNGDAVAIDIVKCYSDCLYNNNDDWLYFTGSEEITEWNSCPIDNLPLGLYWVKTDDITLFHQSNVYSRRIIQLAYKEGIDFTIEYQLIPDNNLDFNVVDHTLEDEQVNFFAKYDADGKMVYNENTHIKFSGKNLFKVIIDYIIEMTAINNNYDLTKKVVNNISGYLGKTLNSARSVGMTTDKDEMFYDWLMSNAIKDDNTCNRLTLDRLNVDGTTVYLYGQKTSNMKVSSGIDKYIQLTDQSNMNLYLLKKKVGGIPLYVNTDCIVSMYGNIPTEKMVQDDDSYKDTFGKYREEKKAVTNKYTNQYRKDRHIEMPDIVKEWNVADINDSSNYEAIYNFALANKGCFISGDAGTGKSYVIKKCIQEGLLDADPKYRFAPTNKSANNINGGTIHRHLGMNIDNKISPLMLNKYKKNDIIVVDEYSMISGNLWRVLENLKRKGVIFIVLGDEKQVPPIGDKREYTDHSYLHNLTNGNKIILTKVHRYDMKLKSHLLDYYHNGDDSAFEKVCDEAWMIGDKHICYTNVTRKCLNYWCMMEYLSYNNVPDSEIVFADYRKQLIENNDDRKVEYIIKRNREHRSQPIWIYKNLPLVSSMSVKDNNIVKGDEFTVVEVNNEKFTVKSFDDQLFEFDVKDIHKYFYVNYAMTIHTSQGSTFDEDLYIWDWDKITKSKDARKLGYTALSRTTNFNRLNIVEDSESFVNDIKSSTLAIFGNCINKEKLGLCF